MRGHLRYVVGRAFDELWQPLTGHDDCPSNVFGEIYAGFRPSLRDPEPEYIKGDDGTIRDVSFDLEYWVSLALNDATIAEELLIDLSGADFESESKALEAVSSTYSILVDIATQDLANCYLDLLKTFISTYNLRYYVDDRAQFWISFSGLSTAMFGHLRKAANGDTHVLQQLNAFEHALAECLADPNETRIKTTIQKQVMVLEAFGLRQHMSSVNTLGQMLKNVVSWPHSSLNEAARKLNDFVNDYPGIRHAGSSNSVIRTLDLRDLTGVTLSLIGLVTYLAEDFELQVGPAIQGDLTTLDDGSISAAPWLDVLTDIMSNP